MSRLHNISSKETMSLDNTVHLIQAETDDDDDMLQSVETRSEPRLVFCAELPLAQSEFYKAAQNSIKSARCLLVNSEDYNGECLAEYDRQVYSVYRIYKLSSGFTELYLEDKEGIR